MMEHIWCVLYLFSKLDLRDQLEWYFSQNPDQIHFSVNCNDMFSWGTGDTEPITPDNLPLLEKAFDDAEAVNKGFGSLHGISLFVCRQRKMRPQGAAYPKEPMMWHLIDACGPQRETGIGNPHKAPSEETTELF
jgi:hypothetical protein